MRQFFLEIWHDASVIDHSIRSGSSHTEPVEYENEGTVFDDTIENYSRLVARIEKMIVRSISKEALKHLPNYVKKYLFV